MFNVSPNWPSDVCRFRYAGEVQAGPLPRLVTQTRGAIDCSKIYRIRREDRLADLIGPGEIPGPLPGELVGESKAGGPLPGGLPVPAPAGINGTIRKRLAVNVSEV